MEEKFGLSTKKFMLEALKEKFNSSPNFIMTNYKGLSALEVDLLRRELRKASSEYFVVKNSMAKRVFDQLKLEGPEEFLKGEVGIGFAGDVIKASKAVVGFSKEHSSLKLNAAFIDGKLENADRIKELAALPPRDVLLGILLNCLNGPITGFSRVLNGLLRNFAHVIDEIKNKKPKEE